MLLPLALAAAPSSPSGEVIGAERVRSIKLTPTRIDDAAITIDGRIDEAAWQRVPLLPTMIQVEPRFGAAPTHESEVRVAYGDKGLYVAFQGIDNPAHVSGAFSRKDQLAPGDRVTLEIDSNNDETTGYRFTVNPSGSQEDAQIFRDDSVEYLWDGVWRTAARKNERGWAAEFFIPWSTLRFRSGDTHTFGINIERWSNEIQERSRLSPTPQGLPGLMSLALDYGPVTGIKPGLNVELRPFVSFRGQTSRAQATPEDPSPERDFSFPPNAGYDVKYGLRGNLTLDLAVNPDFGQAEVDPAVLNLGPFEVYYNERRQFFLESKEIFETRFLLFYSRRVGATPRSYLADKHLPTRGVGDELEQSRLKSFDPITRIYGALRLTGQVAPGWSVGALTATTGATHGVGEYADGSTERFMIDPISQYSVFRIRREYDSQTSVGVILTGVNRGRQDGALTNAFTGGFDYRLRFRERWRHAAQVIATDDGEKTGMGASADLRRGGKNLEVGASLDVLTPHANYNDLGYMRNPNYITNRAWANVYNAQPVGKARRLLVGVASEITGGFTRAYEAKESTFSKELQVKQFDTFLELATDKLWRARAQIGGHWPQLDLYETRGGIAYEVPSHWWIIPTISTPTNRRIAAVVRGAYGEQAGKPGPDAGLEVRLRPVDRLDITASLDVNLVFGRPRWVMTNDLGDPVFGRGDLYSYTAVLRATLGILPTLTLQSFNQLLYSTAHHTEFFILTDPRTLAPTDPAPYYGVVDKSFTSLISNSILRWEYLPGSFLFVVYTHRTAVDDSGNPVQFSPRQGFTNLGVPGVGNEDIVFVKLVHLFSL
ncbi:MAG: DUF5916 domain-containing protein [Nannocystaceae bacterium]